jgi:hypothetical protein
MDILSIRLSRSIKALHRAGTSSCRMSSYQARSECPMVTSISSLEKLRLFWSTGHHGAPLLDLTRTLPNLRFIFADLAPVWVVNSHEISRVSAPHLAADDQKLETDRGIKAVHRQSLQFSRGVPAIVTPPWMPPRRRQKLRHLQIALSPSTPGSSLQDLRHDTACREGQCLQSSRRRPHGRWSGAPGS